MGARRFVPQEPLGFSGAAIVLLWVSALFDPLWFLYGHGAPAAVLKLQMVLLGTVLLILVVGVPSVPLWKSRFSSYAPFLAFVLTGALMIPFAENFGYAKGGTQSLLIWWVFIVASLALVGTVKRAETLLVMYGAQFLWWAAWGASKGWVPWDPALSNRDGFGAFNVGGIGICYFFALAAPPKSWLKKILYVTAAFCAIGVVTSYARAAFLAAMMMAGIIWLRSPNKGKTFFAFLAVGVVTLIAASLLLDMSAFRAEIMSAFSEGTNEGTGQERVILWTAGWHVFLARPIFGAGPGNWGALASTIFRPGELPGIYGNPGALYNMSQHNLYMTTLAERGIVGVVVFVWILIDFWKRNSYLRTPEAESKWRSVGGKFRLRDVALGLEAAMAAFLLDAAVYSMMGIHWFFTMLAINCLLHSILSRLPTPQAAPAPAMTLRELRSGANRRIPGSPYTGNPGLRARGHST